MDWRYIGLATALLVLALGLRAVGIARTIWMWVVPFVLILLFLGVLSKAPGFEASHFVSDPSTNGSPRPPGGH